MDKPYPGLDTPLFGETRRRDKIVNITFVVVTAIFVLETILMAVVSSVFFHDREKCKRLNDGRDPKFCVSGVDIVMSFVIMLLLIPQILVAWWYRKGELEPKFRKLIYYNAVVTVLLCFVANFYFFQLGLNGTPATPCPPTQSQ